MLMLYSYKTASADTTPTQMALSSMVESRAGRGASTAHIEAVPWAPGSRSIAKQRAESTKSLTGPGIAEAIIEAAATAAFLLALNA